jgi:hypothetical protein
MNADEPAPDLSDELELPPRSTAPLTLGNPVTAEGAPASPNPGTGASPTAIPRYEDGLGPALRQSEDDTDTGADA